MTTTKESKKLIFLIFLFLISIYNTFSYEQLIANFTETAYYNFTHSTIQKFNGDYYGTNSTDWTIIDYSLLSWIEMSDFYYTIYLVNQSASEIYKNYSYTYALDDTTYTAKRKDVSISNGVYVYNWDSQEYTIVVDVLFKQYYMLLEKPNVSMFFDYHFNTGTHYCSATLLEDNTELLATNRAVINNYNATNLKLNFSQDYTGKFNRVIWFCYGNDAGTPINEYLLKYIKVAENTDTDFTFNSTFWNSTGLETTNYLPEGSSTITTEYCYNNTTNSNDFFNYDINIDYTDNEGDTIYYSLNPTDYSSFYIQQSDYFTIYTEGTVNDIYGPTYNFMDSPRLYTNFTTANTMIKNQFWQLFGWLSEAYLGFTDGISNYENKQKGYDQQYYLSVDSGAELTYLYEKPLTFGSMIETILNFPTEDTKMSYIVYSELGNMIQNITFWQYNTSTLFIRDSSGWIYNGTSAYSKDSYSGIYIKTLTEPISNNITSYIYHLDNSNNEISLATSSSTSNEVNSIPYIRLMTNPADINTFATGHRFFRVESFVLSNNLTPTNYSWTTTKPTTGSASVNGDEVNIFITDSFHLGDTLKIETLTISPEACERKTTYTGNYTTEINIFNVLKNDFGFRNAISDYCDVFTQELCQSAIWYIWIFLFITTLIATYQFTKTINIYLGFIGPSLICIVLSIMAGYAIHLLSFIVLGSLGLAMPFVNDVLGNQGGN